MSARARSEPRRILLAIESSGPGGAEHMVLRLAAALQRAGDAPVIATLRPGWLTERAHKASFPVWIAPQRAGLDPLWIARFALRLRRERIALVHSHEFGMNAYAGAAARLARLPSVATVHGHQWATGRRRRIAAYRALRRGGMALVSVSEELAGFLSRGLGLSRGAIRVVTNGVPVPELPRGGVEPARARAQLGLPPGGALVVAVGNLYPVKDHATLIRALALPGSARLADARLAIAGRGEEEPRLRALAAELGIAARVHLLGLRDDVAAVLGAADVFAQPSRSEGLPLALLEAMGAGLPVVASRVGGMAEVVRDGENGCLVPPAEPALLAAALARVLADPERASQMAAAARRTVQAEYSVERMAERYRALYAERLSAS